MTYPIMSYKYYVSQQIENFEPSKFQTSKISNSRKTNFKWSNMEHILSQKHESANFRMSNKKISKKCLASFLELIWMIWYIQS